MSWTSSNLTPEHHLCVSYLSTPNDDRIAPKRPKYGDYKDSTDTGFASNIRLFTASAADWVLPVVKVLFQLHWPEWFVCNGDIESFNIRHCSKNHSQRWKCRRLIPVEDIKVPMLSCCASLTDNACWSGQLSVMRRLPQLPRRIKYTNTGNLSMISNYSRKIADIQHGLLAIEKGKRFLVNLFQTMCQVLVYQTQKQYSKKGKTPVRCLTRLKQIVRLGSKWFTTQRRVSSNLTSTLDVNRSNANQVLLKVQINVSNHTTTSSSKQRALFQRERLPRKERGQAGLMMKTRIHLTVLKMKTRLLKQTKRTLRSFYGGKKYISTCLEYDVLEIIMHLMTCGWCRCLLSDASKIKIESPWHVSRQCCSLNEYNFYVRQLLLCILGTQACLIVFFPAMAFLLFAQGFRLSTDK